MIGLIGWEVVGVIGGAMGGERGALGTLVGAGARKGEVRMDDAFAVSD